MPAATPGEQLPTIRSLYCCPYRATSVFLRPQKSRSYPGGNSCDTGGIVPALADDGIYIASESSFHRVLRAQGQMNRRGRSQPPRTSRPPTTHIATAPAEVWCWDLTFLPAQMQGRWFYPYLILDLYSRKIVGFEVHDT